jgi:hypothetical protein
MSGLFPEDVDVKRIFRHLQLIAKDHLGGLMNDESGCSVQDINDYCHFDTNDLPTEGSLQMIRDFMGDAEIESEYNTYGLSMFAIYFHSQMISGHYAEVRHSIK